MKATLSALAAGLVLSVPAGSAKSPIKYWSPAWSPDGKRIAFVDREAYHGDLYVMDADGGNFRRLTRTNSSLFGADDPAWSPDSRRIAFAFMAGTSEQGVYVVNREGTGLRRLAKNASFPDWSPGGRKIAYTSCGEGCEAVIKVMRPDGSQQRLVARAKNGNGSFYSPTWSPRGVWIAFSAEPAPDGGGGTDFLAVTRGPGERVRRLLKRHATSSDWSPDGKRIAFWSGYPESNIYVLTLATHRVKRLHAGSHPSWAPDGRRIVFAGRNGGIYVMNANGRAVRRLV